MLSNVKGFLRKTSTKKQTIAQREEWSCETNNAIQSSDQKYNAENSFHGMM